MQINLDTFKHLLPRARAWRLTADKKLRQFFTGLTDAPRDAQSYQDDTWSEYRPQDTTQLSAWESQFGLLPTDATEQDRRDRLAAAWRALGGQSPQYLQDTVRAAGFDVYLYESFFRVGSQYEYRKPWLYLDDGRYPDYITANGVMGADGFQLGEADALMAGFFNFGPVISTVQMGETPVQMGEPDALLGAFRRLGELLTDPLPAGSTIPVEGQESEWPYVLYWGGPPSLGQPTTAVVPKDREDEFKTLILKLSPAQQWHGLIIDFL